MTPHAVARRLMRAGADPGLIAAYIAEELRRDPYAFITARQTRYLLAWGDTA